MVPFSFLSLSLCYSGKIVFMDERVTFMFPVLSPSPASCCSALPPVLHTVVLVSSWVSMLDLAHISWDKLDCDDPVYSWCDQTPRWPPWVPPTLLCCGCERIDTAQCCVQPFAHFYRLSPVSSFSTNSITKSQIHQSLTSLSHGALFSHHLSFWSISNFFEPFVIWLETFNYNAT